MGTEGEGFEPPGRGWPAQWFSRPPHSTALPPLQGEAHKASGSRRLSATGAGLHNAQVEGTLEPLETVAG
jgi:hypothetical protein